MSNEPWSDDTEFSDGVVKSVEAYEGGGWAITKDDGWSFFVPAESPVVPKVGMACRMYGAGNIVRGLLLDGQCALYRSRDEWERYVEEERYGKDAADLLRKWDAGETVWSVAMGGIGPGYEQAIQVAMFELLRAMLATGVDAKGWDDPAKLAADRESIKAAANEAISALGLSGAQFGAAMNLAASFRRKGPVDVMKRAPDDRKIQVSNRWPGLRTSNPVEAAR